MSERKLKPGDKVKIILEDDGSWNEDVTALIGKTVTIKECYDYGEYKIYEDNDTWAWHEEDFEIIDEEEIDMMKYKAGDKVVLRDDLKKYAWYGEYRIENKMHGNIGQVVTIKEVSCSDYTLTDGTEYYTDEMIDHERTKELNRVTRADELSNFTKSDLKSGHVIRTRDGYLYIFMKNEFDGEDYMFNQKTKGHMELTDYNEDLIFSRDKGLDIIKVYEPLATYALKGVGDRVFNTSNDIDKYFKLVYEKKEPKEMTLKEVEKQLGHKIKLVKETIE